MDTLEAKEAQMIGSETAAWQASGECDCQRTTDRMKSQSKANLLPGSGLICQYLWNGRQAEKIVITLTRKVAMTRPNPT